MDAGYFHIFESNLIIWGRKLIIYYKEKTFHKLLLLSNAYLYFSMSISWEQNILETNFLLSFFIIYSIKNSSSEACARAVKFYYIYKWSFELMFRFSWIVLVMADQTMLFYSLRELYQRLCFYSPETNQTHPFNWKIIFCVSSIILMFITSFSFFLWKAETLDEYGTSFYGSVTQLSAALYFVIVVWKMPVILKLLRSFEDFIESSELWHNETIVHPLKCIKFFLILNPLRGSQSNFTMHVYQTNRKNWTYVSIAQHFLCERDVLWSYDPTIAEYNGQLLCLRFERWVNISIATTNDVRWKFSMEKKCQVSKSIIEICFSFWRLPFNWKTPSGYFAAWIFQSIGFLCTLFSVPGFNGLYFGSCWLFVAFAKDLANDLPQLNANKAHRQNLHELKSHFCRTVQYYSDMKELSGIYWIDVIEKCRA